MWDQAARIAGLRAFQESCRDRLIGAYTFSEANRPEMAIRDYEDVVGYAVDDEKRERLLALQTECSVTWTTKQGWPVSVMHRFAWHDGKIWVTCSGHRKRVSALRRDGRSCVILSSEGTALGPDQTVTIKTAARRRIGSIRPWPKS